MSDFLATLVARSLSARPLQATVQPRLPSRFEPDDSTPPPLLLETTGESSAPPAPAAVAPAPRFEPVPNWRAVAEPAPVLRPSPAPLAQPVDSETRSARAPRRDHGGESTADVATAAAPPPATASSRVRVKPVVEHPPTPAPEVESRASAATVSPAPPVAAIATPAPAARDAHDIRDTRDDHDDSASAWPTSHPGRLADPPRVVPSVVARPVAHEARPARVFATPPSAPPPPPVVHVTIGRLEIRATPVGEPARAHVTPPPPMTLEAYLARRRRERGGSA